MDRKKALENKNIGAQQFQELNALHDTLFEEFKNQFDRSLPFTDELFDRWDRAKKLGFGEGSSIYDSSYIFGNVKVGKQTWIGPFTIIDGSGGLEIGDNCTISSAVHIYSHDNLKSTLSGGKIAIEHAQVTIGNNTYLGPHSIIAKGVSIGNHCVVASNSFVNKNMKDNSIYAGNPAKCIGHVRIFDNKIEFDYTVK